MGAGPFLAVTQGGIPERSGVTTAKRWTGGERIAPLAADPGDELGTVWNRCVARAVFPTGDARCSRDRT